MEPGETALAASFRELYEEIGIRDCYMIPLWDYEQLWDDGVGNNNGREAFFYDGKEHLRKHHLYVCTKDAAELRRHLTFRDDLRSNPDAVAGYSRVKEEVVNDKMTLVFYEKHID